MTEPKLYIKKNVKQPNTFHWNSHTPMIPNRGGAKGGRGGAAAPLGPPKKKKMFWFLILSFLFSVFKVRTVVGFFFFFKF